MTTENSLADQVLGGDNRSLQELAADGILPVAPEELLSIQIRLAQLDDEVIAAKARASFQKLGPDALVPFVRGEAEPDELSFIARSTEEPQVIEAVLQNQGIRLADLVALAGKVDSDLQEIVLLRQDLIVEHPEILAALEANPDLGRFARRRIDEYRLHLLPSDRAATPELEEAAQPIPHVDGIQDLSDEEQAEVAAAIQEVREDVEPEGEVDPRTGLAEGQIRALTAPIRAKLARGATRSLRSILIRDPNPQVATLVLTASAITESEIEQVSGNRYVCEEVLSAICNRREWVGKYAILHNLVRNPRTAVGIAVKFVARLSVRDLGLLRMDRNVPDAVRQMALRLHRLKTQ